MKNLIYIFFLLISISFINCTKKTSDKLVENDMTNLTSNDWRATAPNPGPARNVELGEYSSFDLDNGLKVIVVENHKLPRVSYQISLLNDPILEGKKAGYVSMSGDLLSTGTTNRTKAEIDETVDFYGANLNTSSSGIFLSSLKKHAENLMEVYTDILYNPSFPAEEFEKLKTQSLSGLESQKTDPNSISANVTSKVLYGEDHPYGEVETEQSIKNITLDDVKSYYNNYFKPNNAYLIIVGDITQNEAKAQAKKYFGKWKAGDIPVQKFKKVVGPSETKVAFANKDGAVQSVIRVTYPVDLKPNSPDVLAASAMNQLLGGGAFSGRLMQNLREDKAYTYGARSSLTTDALVGAFSAGASVRNEVTDSSVHEIIYELNRMITEPVDPEDLQLIKNSMAGGFARSLESPQTIARFARNTYKYNLPKDYYNTYLSRLEKIKPSDISAMASKYIKPENTYVVVVGNKDEVAETLLRFDTDSIIDYYDAYGNELNYEAVAMPEGTTAESVIENYLNAIGGTDKLKDVKTLVTNGGLDLMGQQAKLTIKIKAPNKMLNKMEMGGMVMQEQKFDGNKASISGMGQTETFVSGDPQFEQTKNQAKLFEQLLYNTDQYTTDLKGIEDFDGAKHYKLIVSKGDQKETQYYDIKTSLLSATVMSEGEAEEVRSVTTKFSDYRDADGIMLPYSMTILGAAPFPLEMKISSYGVNVPIEDSEFEIK